MRDLAETDGIAVSVRDDQRLVRCGLEQLPVARTVKLLCCPYIVPVGRLTFAP
jgi:hypothetical protein